MLSADEQAVLAFIELRAAMFHGSPRRDKIAELLPGVDVKGALKRLTKEGLIEQVRRKARVVVYTATDKGRVALKEWQRGAL